MTAVNANEGIRKQESGESIETITVQKIFIKDGQFSAENDWVVVERPLLMEISYETNTGYESQKISLTMRTPGADEELLLGYLITEGILQSYQQVQNVHLAASCAQKTADTIHLRLKKGIAVDLRGLKRFAAISSACGACGKVSTAELFQSSPFPAAQDHWQLPVDAVHGLKDLLTSVQCGYATTGGMHAAALVDRQRRLLAMREDVGRHNALDKLIGFAAMQDMLPLQQYILLLSGRLSFELVQKAGMVGIPIVVGIGAPSSLAIDTAKRFGITLIGFLKATSFSVYTCQERICDAKKF
ncbi:MAG: formate dehydrogenase accessory sulfurtransferase FdhD [Oligoflexus sp.]